MKTKILFFVFLQWHHHSSEEINIEEDEVYDDVDNDTEDIAALVCFENLSDSFSHFLLLFMSSENHGKEHHCPLQWIILDLEHHCNGLC